MMTVQSLEDIMFPLSQNTSCNLKRNTFAIYKFNETLTRMNTKATYFNVKESRQKQYHIGL